MTPFRLQHQPRLPSQVRPQTDSATACRRHALTRRGARLATVALAWLLAGPARAGGATGPYSPPAPSQPPSFGLYYGKDPPVELLSAYDVAVVEPDSGFDPLAHRLPHTTWFAYASVGEVLPSRSYYADLR